MSQAPTGTAGVESLITESPQSVTVFTLSWCSFCHAAKRLLKGQNIPFFVVELDTGIFREPALNARLRQELFSLTGSQTLPQVFVGKQNVGGFTETQAAVRQGHLATLLAAQAAERNAGAATKSPSSTLE
jgi:glutaredoxin